MYKKIFWEIPGYLRIIPETGQEKYNIFPPAVNPNSKNYKLQFYRDSLFRNKN